jgi:hypothetical protein
LDLLLAATIKFEQILCNLGKSENIYCFCKVGVDAVALSAWAARQSPPPSFAVIGGDVTYANAIPTW